MTGSPGSNAQDALPLLGDAALESIAGEVACLVREGGVRFQRGDALPYFRSIARLQASLTLPVVQGARSRDAVLLKCLYSLWNFVVDDSVDRDVTTRELDASAAFILTGAGLPDSGASVVLRRMAEIVPGGRIEGASILGFDLLEVIHGLRYEHLINSAPSLATASEYRRYSTMTASLKVLLDIDGLFSDPRSSPAVYRVLREAYDELTCAVKLASDIGTLRREVHDEDSMNLLRILAQDDTGSHLRARPGDDAVPSLLKLSQQVAEMSRAHLRRAEALFGEAAEVDSRSVLHAMKQVIGVYLSGTDPFFT